MKKWFVLGILALLPAGSGLNSALPNQGERAVWVKDFGANLTSSSWSIFPGGFVQLHFVPTNPNAGVTIRVWHRRQPGLTDTAQIILNGTQVIWGPAVPPANFAPALVINVPGPLPAGVNILDFVNLAGPGNYEVSTVGIW